MCRTRDRLTQYAPLYIHTFRLITPHKIQEAQKFNRQYHSYAEIKSIPDRLRWCRYQKGMLQRQVAQYIGISREQYVCMENGTADHYPKEIVDRLAKLFCVPVYDFLDEYNRFMYKGQGRMIHEYCAQFDLEKNEFAKRYNIPLKNLTAWESEQKRMSRASWQRYFSDASLQT